MSEVPDETPQAVVIVTPTIMDGTVVRWYRDSDAVVYGAELLSASRNGVMVLAHCYLHQIPPAWIEAATAAYQDLKAGRSVAELATHRTRFGHRSVVEPIEPTVTL